MIKLLLKLLGALFSWIALISIFEAAWGGYYDPSTFRAKRKSSEESPQDSN
jgi:cyclic lactone autoinducer peptide